MKQQTYTKFVDKMQMVNPDIEIISMYKSDKDKIKCKCYIDEDYNTLIKNIQNLICPR